MNRTVFRAFFITLFVGVSLMSARAFDFSAVCGTGQTLYYNILSDSTVAVTYANHVGTSYYSGYQAPTGSVQVPAIVVHGGSTYSVVALGANAFSGCSGLTALSIPTSVTAIGSSACSQCSGMSSVVIPSTVTAIGDNAFMGCSQLEGVVLPDAVTMVGVGTFQGCSSLAAVTFGSSVTTIGNVAFEGCSSLTSLIIPDAVTMLGNWAFCNCTSLDSLYIGTSVSYLFNNTFAGCSAVSYLYYNARNASCSYYSGGTYFSALPVGALTKLVIGDSVQSVNQYAFANATLLDTVVVGSGVLSIHANAFSGTGSVRCLYYNTDHFTDATYPRAAFSPFAGLTRVVVGNGVHLVPCGAFAGKTALQQVDLGSSVTIIGDSAFFGCTALQGPLQLPTVLTTIGVSAFQGCGNINGVLLLPNTLQSIGAKAFAGCAAINGALSIPNSVQSMGNGAFSNCDSLLSVTINSAFAIPTDAFNGCDRLFRVTLSSAIPAIGNAAFRNCARLSEVSLGNALQTIGSNAFSGCIRLANPMLPNSLTTIGDSAFCGCSQMGGNLLFPAAVTSIGDYAFAGLSPVTRIDMRSSVPPTIYSHTFASAALSTPVFVPCGATVNYLVTDYWEDFTNINESAPFILTINVNDTAMGTATILQHPTCSNYQARIQAVANGGFHFLRWADGSTDNPRQMMLSSDTIFTAIFVSDNSYISVAVNDSARGTVTGAGLYSYNDTVTLTAIPNAAYHFQRWSDGNTQNPRTIIVTQDSLFVAIFLSNISTLVVSSSNPAMGTVSGGGTYNYQDQAVITAVPAYGYHFTSWNDGITTNPRTVVISQDTAFIATFASNNYSLSVTSSNTAMGSAQGSGSYNYLDTATLTATALYGYRFVQWSDGITANPRTVVVISDSTITAQFAPIVYQLTVVANDTSLGTIYGSGSFNYNTSAIISATPNVGCHFIQWNDGNTTNPRSVLVTGNATYTAQFSVNVYSIMVSSANPAMGSVSGGGSYSHNTTVTLTAIPATGYHFVQWNDGNTSNPRTITATHNASYIAQFAINTYTLSLASNNTSLGTVSGGGNYAYNSTVTITATPNYGYHFVQWNDGNTSNPRTITITQNLSYTAQFDTNQYSVIALSSNAASGSVSGSGMYNYLSQAILTATPQPHYHFVGWNDSLTNNPRLLTVISDTQLVAHFQIDSHTVAVSSSNPTMGHTSGSGIVAYGDAVYISATANYGYRFTTWSDGISLNPRRVVVASDTAFTAQFVSNMYSALITSNDTTLGVVSGGGTYSYLTPLTLTATPFGGSRFVSWSDGNTDNPRTLILTGDTVLQAQFVVNTCRIDCYPSDSTMGIVSGSGTYNYGTQVAILATAFAHHHFVQWSDGVTTNPRLITVTADTTLTAYFEQEGTFTITVTTNDSQLGTVSGSGQYHYGDEAHLSATPRTHCRFLYWSDGNTANPRTVHVIADAVYQAVFGPDMFTVTLTPSNPELGAVYGGGEYPYGEQAVITAVPFPDAHFRGWSDGSADNPRTIRVTSNITLQALFGSQLGIDDAGQEADGFTVTTYGRELHILGADNRAIYIFDLYGRQVAHLPQTVGESVITLPSAGVYLVRPEGFKPRKVVVL